MIHVRGKTVVITGTFALHKRQAIQQKLIRLGAKVVGSVSSKTDMIFAGEAAGSKLDRARQLGVTVYRGGGLRKIMHRRERKPHYMLRYGRWYKVATLAAARHAQTHGWDSIQTPTLVRLDNRQTCA